MADDAEAKTVSANPIEPGFLDHEEIQKRLAALTSADCWRLERIAAIYADGTHLSPKDLLQEAFVGALQRRAWRDDLETRVFLTGVMRSLASAQRKAQAVNALDAGLGAREEERKELLEGVPNTDRDDPAELALASEARDSLSTALDSMFRDDPQVLRVIRGRMLGEAPRDIRSALGLDQTQYESVCRRLLRGYQKSIKADRHE